MRDGESAAGHENGDGQRRGNGNSSAHRRTFLVSHAFQQNPEDIPVVGDIPVKGQGAACDEKGTDGLGVRTSGGGLRPPVPSSVEPSGMPTRPTADADPIPVGDEADAAGAAAAPLAVPTQVPDAVPMPPPSKTVLEPDMPEDAVIGFPIPDDACGSTSSARSSSSCLLPDPAAIRRMSSG